MSSHVFHYDSKNATEIPDDVQIITVSDASSLRGLIPAVPSDLILKDIIERTFSYRHNDHLVWILVVPKTFTGLTEQAIKTRIHILLEQGPPRYDFSTHVFPECQQPLLIPNLRHQAPDLTDDVDFQLFDIWYDAFKAEIHLFGKTRDSYSVHVIVDKLRFGIRISHSANDEEELERIAEELAKTEERKRTDVKYSIEKSWPLDQYRKDPVPVVKITANRFSALNRIKKLAVEEHGCQTYHGNINAASHFCVNRNIQTHSIVRVTNYKLVEDKQSFCDYELRAAAKNVSKAPEQINYSALLMGLDIETLFVRPPSSKLDPIANIAVVGYKTGTKVADRKQGLPEKWEWKYLFCLGDTPDTLDGATILSFKTERALLIGFFDFLHNSNVDGIVGHNVRNFDIKYIIERCEFLRVEPRFGKLTASDKVTTFRLDWMENKAMGRMETVRINDMQGVFIMDTLDMAKKGFGGKLKSHKLEFLAQTFLGQGKEDVSYDEILPVFFSGPAGRLRLASYCLKDTELSLQLMIHWDKYNEAAEFCKLSSYLPINNVETTGVTTRLTNVLLWYVVHILNRPILFLDKEPTEKDGKYDGALVLDPTVGFHRYVTTLDFESLYPSIMMEGNISPDAVIIHQFKDEDIIRDGENPSLPPDNCPGGHPIKVKYRDEILWIRPSLVKPGNLWFVEKSHHEGVFAKFLNWLKSERAEYKRQMKQHLSGTAEYFSLNNKQNAVKLMMNSLYGAMGSTFGSLSFVDLAAEVTSRGRWALNRSMTRFREYSTAHNITGEVVYGDTDSIFIKVDLFKNVEDAKERAEEIISPLLTYINSGFNAPMKMAFEKTIDIIMMNKKRYSYINHTDREKINSKGIESTRSQCTKFAEQTQKHLLDLLLRNPETPDLAFKFIEDESRRLLRGQVPLEELELSMGLSKAEYKNEKLRHVYLYKQMIERKDPNTPKIGERIHFVMVKKCEGHDNYMAVETRDFVERNATLFAVDYDHYFDKEVRTPSVRILELFDPQIDTRVFKRVLDEERPPNKRQKLPLNPRMPIVSAFFPRMSFK